jgi:hypothetical protein
MNCQELEGLIPDLAREPAPEIPAPALAHLKQCARCGERLDEERRLTCRLTAFAAASRIEDQAPERVEETLRAVFRRRSAPAPAAPARSWRGWAAVAAMGSVAAGIWLVKLPSKSAQPSPPRPAVTANRIVEPAVPPPVQPLAPRVQASHRPRRRAPRQPPPQPQPELRTEFFPVAQGDDWTPVDGAELMRVELPKSALGAFGLPVEPWMGSGPGSERVRADVVLSDDGLLRAIRFVR